MWGELDKFVTVPFLQSLKEAGFVEGQSGPAIPALHVHNALSGWQIPATSAGKS
jgi:hypothetical protein